MRRERTMPCMHQRRGQHQHRHCHPAFGFDFIKMSKPVSELPIHTFSVATTNGHLHAIHLSAIKFGPTHKIPELDALSLQGQRTDTGQKEWNRQRLGLGWRVEADWGGEVVVGRSQPAKLINFFRLRHRRNAQQQQLLGPGYSFTANNTMGMNLGRAAGRTSPAIQSNNGTTIHISQPRTRFFIAT